MLSLNCKHVQHVKIYIPCNFEVNLMIHRGVIALFSSNILKMTGTFVHVVGLSHFVRPSGYKYMVCPAISSYSFGATALIFCRMFIHNGGVHVHRILIFFTYSQNDR